MPKRQDLKKVMVIGSGPIVIGQAAEFDYAGTQACKTLKEEGVEVILVNSNPATIMTDENIADKVYLEPLNIESITRILKKEKPQGIIPSLGGQTGLNLACQLAEEKILEKLNIELLGTNLQAIKKSEDRKKFKETMQKIKQPTPKSVIVSSWLEAMEFCAEIDFPIIIRPAYTLGGTGGGIAKNPQELKEMVILGLQASPIGQVILEQSLFGWKEIEFEVMRDKNDNCLVICTMENMDPLGIHTGDSIVFAPVQTLSGEEFHLLRRAALNIISTLGVEGGCNVQFGKDPHSLDYVVIEVNPRVSRSSALASKATGYPIAQITTQIALGYTLDELINPLTGTTSACLEPSIDYVVTKIPRWPFDKFINGNRRLGTQMKATGEVMALERSLEASFLKAIRSLEEGEATLLCKEASTWTDIALENKLKYADDQRIFAIAEAFRRQWSIKEIQQLTHIAPFFLAKIQNIINMEKELKEKPFNEDLLLRAKKMGFSNEYVVRLTGRNRIPHIMPVYKQVDSCAGEYPARAPYYYSCYESEDEVPASVKAKVLVLGSGPIRIGQGIEFDYCSVHAVWAIQEAGYEAIIINNNPETVSTDFDTSDRLYFDPLDLEDVLNITKKEKPLGIVVQFGGQTAINLAEALEKQGVKILGTSVDNIDLAEDRKKFEHFLNKIQVPQTQGQTATRVEEVEKIAQELGFPLLVRPSYVLGGRAMRIVYNLPELVQYVESAVEISPSHPILIDKYIQGKEVEVDALCDGETVLIPGIMEHIERAGVHSGDSMAVFPPQSLSQKVKEKIIKYTEKIGRGLNIQGIFNIQFVVDQEEAYVLEVNPRASRTVPILSKVTGIPMVKLATWIMLGKSLKELGYRSGLAPEPNYTVVKAPVFSFNKLSQVDTFLGPEMKSTGEVLGIDKSFPQALYKAMVASGLKLPHQGDILVSLAKKDREEALTIVKAYLEKGFQIRATSSTAQYLQKQGLPIIITKDPLEDIKAGKIELVLNTPSQAKSQKTRGFKIRRLACEYGVPCFTALDTAHAFIKILNEKIKSEDLNCLPLQAY